MKLVESIFSKIKEKLGVDSVTKVLFELDIKKGTYDSWVSKDRIPTPRLHAIATKTKIPVHILMDKDAPLNKEITIAKIKASFYADIDLANIPKIEIDKDSENGDELVLRKKGYLVLDSDTLGVDWEDLQAMQVNDVSMLPTISLNSWIIFDKTRTFVGDGLYVINWRNLLMVKAVQITSGGKMKISSANLEYESYCIDPSDESVFRIVGKVVKTIM